MKKRLVFIFTLLFLLLQLNLPVFGDEIPIGTDIGDILATDIVAKINGFTIPSFNINNSMVIYAKHLNNYGFDVIWDGEKRQVNIKLNLDKTFDPIPTEEGTALQIGTKLGDVLYTDIKTFINGTEVQSFNINGSTAIYFRDLREFGTVNWDGTKRISSLATDHPDYTDVDKTYEPSEVSRIAGPAVVYIEAYDSYGELLSSGSGFIVDKTGLIVTNYHVLEDAYSATVKLVDGRAFEVIDAPAYSEQRDIAVLKIQGQDLPVVSLGDSDKVESGEKILTIGSPIGLENTISDGLISNKNRVIDEQSYFQISAPISHGSSGGALLNFKAQVIGVTSATFVEGQNLNLAIPINEVKPYITEALEQVDSDTSDDEDPLMDEDYNESGYQIIEYENGEIYEGEIEYGLYNGWGTYHWSDGDVYDGQWVDGERNGYGVMTWAEGDKYEGYFVEGFRHGEGTYTWADGEQYEGEFLYGDRHGRGIYTYSDGTVESGIWSYNEFIGEELEAPQNPWAIGASSTDVWAYWDHVYGADYYHIYYSYSPFGEYEPILDSDDSIYEFYPDDYYDACITNIEPGTTIYLKITAVVGGEESELSEMISVETLDAMEAPTGLWAKAVSATEINVGWNEVTDAGYYYLYRSDSLNGTYYPYEDEYGYPIEFDWDSDYCVNIYNIQPGKTVYFKVVAVRDGEESEFSDAAYATTPKY